MRFSAAMIFLLVCFPVISGTAKADPQSNSEALDKISSLLDLRDRPVAMAEGQGQSKDGRTYPCVLEVKKMIGVPNGKETIDNVSLIITAPSPYGGGKLVMGAAIHRDNDYRRPSTVIYRQEMTDNSISLDFGMVYDGSPFLLGAGGSSLDISVDGGGRKLVKVSQHAYGTFWMTCVVDRL